MSAERSKPMTDAELEEFRERYTQEPMPPCPHCGTMPEYKFTDGHGPIYICPNSQNHDTYEERSKHEHDSWYDGPWVDERPLQLIAEIERLKREVEVLDHRWRVESSAKLTHRIARDRAEEENDALIKKNIELIEKFIVERDGLQARVRRAEVGDTPAVLLLRKIVEEGSTYADVDKLKLNARITVGQWLELTELAKKGAKT